MIVIPAKTAPAEEDEAAAEARRERLRGDPNVIVHKQTHFGPFVQEIWVENPVDVLELLGRYDDDEPDEVDSDR